MMGRSGGAVLIAAILLIGVFRTPAPVAAFQSYDDYVGARQGIAGGDLAGALKSLLRFTAREGATLEKNSEGVSLIAYPLLGRGYVYLRMGMTDQALSAAGASFASRPTVAALVLVERILRTDASRQAAWKQLTQNPTSAGFDFRDDLRKNAKSEVLRVSAGAPTVAVEVGPDRTTVKLSVPFDAAHAADFARLERGDHFMLGADGPKWGVRPAGNGLDVAALRTALAERPAADPEISVRLADDSGPVPMAGGNAARPVVGRVRVQAEWGAGEADAPAARWTLEARSQLVPGPDASSRQVAWVWDTVAEPVKNGSQVLRIVARWAPANGPEKSQLKTVSLTVANPAPTADVRLEAGEGDDQVAVIVRTSRPLDTARSSLTVDGTRIKWPVLPRPDGEPRAFTYRVIADLPAAASDVAAVTYSFTFNDERSRSDNPSLPVPGSRTVTVRAAPTTPGSQRVAVLLWSKPAFAPERAVVTMRTADGKEHSLEREAAGPTDGPVEFVLPRGAEVASGWARVRAEIEGVPAPGIRIWVPGTSAAVEDFRISPSRLVRPGETVIGCVTFAARRGAAPEIRVGAESVRTVELLPDGRTALFYWTASAVGTHSVAMDARGGGTGIPLADIEVRPDAPLQRQPGAASGTSAPAGGMTPTLSILPERLRRAAKFDIQVDLNGSSGGLEPRIEAAIGNRPPQNVLLARHPAWPGAWLGRISGDPALGSRLQVAAAIGRGLGDERTVQLRAGRGETVAIDAGDNPLWGPGAHSISVIGVGAAAAPPQLWIRLPDGRPAQQVPLNRSGLQKYEGTYSVARDAGVGTALLWVQGTGGAVTEVFLASSEAPADTRILAPATAGRDVRRLPVLVSGAGPAGPADLLAMVHRGSRRNQYRVRLEQTGSPGVRLGWLALDAPWDRIELAARGAGGKLCIVNAQ